jgi:hypothetical protein
MSIKFHKDAAPEAPTDAYLNTLFIVPGSPRIVYTA